MRTDFVEPELARIQTWSMPWTVASTAQAKHPENLQPNSED